MSNPPEVSEEAEQDFDVLLERMMLLIEKWMQERDGFIPCGAAIGIDGEVVGHMAHAGDAATEKSTIDMLLGGLQRRARAGEIRASCVCWDGQLEEHGQSVRAIVAILEHVRGPSLLLHRPYRKSPEGTYEYAQMQASRIPPEVFAET